MASDQQVEFTYNPADGQGDFEPQLYKFSAISPFFQRNRDISDQKWVLNPVNSSSKGNVYNTFISDGNPETKYNLTISFLRSGAIDIKITSDPPPKFDLSKEDTIIDQTALGEHEPFKVISTTKVVTITSSIGAVVLGVQPFKISIRDPKGKTRLVFNQSDSAVYEQGDPSPPETWGDFTDTPRDGPTAVALDATFLGPNIQISGIPSHALPLTLGETPGEPIRLYNSDLAHFPLNSPMSLYGSVPLVFAHSDDAATGLFWLNASDTFIDLKNFSEDSKTTRFVSESQPIRFFVFLADTPSQISENYTALTGRPFRAPIFSFGFHQCRWGYASQEEILGVSKKLDQVSCPHDCLWFDLDWTKGKRYWVWNNETFPDPIGMLDELAKNGRFLTIIVDPHIRVDEEYIIYKESSEKKLLVLDKDGKEFQGLCWPGLSVWPDFLNPETRDWWASNFHYDKHPLRPNVGIWNDMNEMAVFDGPEKTAPRDLLHVNDVEERVVHNLYGHLMVAGTSKGLLERDVLIGQPKHRQFILTRSHFAGSQKFAFTWSGDNKATFEYLAASISMTLNSSLGGIVFTGSDVTGFFGNPSEDLWTAWYEIGAWIYPFFRCHCHIGGAFREVYRKEGEQRDRAIAAIKERYQVLPYWYLLAKEANETGHPLVRPVWYHFPNSEWGKNDDSLLIGSSLFVHPICTAYFGSVWVSLPRGVRWYDWRTGEEVGESFRVNPTHRALVYQRGGSVIPIWKSEGKSTSELLKTPISVVVAVDGNGKADGDVYLDDGSTFAYLEGKRSDWKIHVEGNRVEFRGKGAIQWGEVILIGLAKVPSAAKIERGVGLELVEDGPRVVIPVGANAPNSAKWTILLS